MSGYPTVPVRAHNHRTVRTLIERTCLSCHGTGFYWYRSTLGKQWRKVSCEECDGAGRTKSTVQILDSEVSY